MHSTETFGTADGPGIRYVLFLSGCPLRCHCHNPDTWHRKDGTLTAVEDILSDIGSYRNFFGRGRGRGGVTLSGGEPLVQPKFCKAILRGCKAMGLHTALDTSGYLGKQADDELLADVDLVLLDIKAASGHKYKSLTGVPLDPTIRFAERLANMHKPVWLRYVLVPGITDNLDDIESLATFAAAVMLNASMCCLSTKWGSTNGASAGWIIRSLASKHRHMKWSARRAKRFAPPVCW